MTDVAIIVVIGIGTYLFRLSFIGLLGARPMPEWAAAPLRYVAPAVLAAIVAPAVLLRDGALDLAPLSNPRFLAAGLAIVVAWRTKSVAAVIVVGMITVWALQALA
jgi:branched-subunit amino acid transport protein